MLARTACRGKTSLELLGLPADVVCLALSFLPPHDLLCSFALVSREAHSLAFSPAAWHEVHITRASSASSLTQNRSSADTSSSSSSSSSPASGPASGATRRAGAGDASASVALDDAALHALLVRRGSWSRLRVLHLDASSALTDAAAESIELFAAGAVGGDERARVSRTLNEPIFGDRTHRQSHSKAVLDSSLPFSAPSCADSVASSGGQDYDSQLAVAAQIEEFGDVGGSVGMHGIALSSDAVCAERDGGILPLLRDLSLASCQWLRARSTLCALVNAAPALTALDIRYSNSARICVRSQLRFDICNAKNESYAPLPLR